MRSFMIERKCVCNSSSSADNVIWQDEHHDISVKSCNFTPLPFCKQSGKGIVYVIGSPIVDGRIEREKVAVDLLLHGIRESSVAQLNGEFLLIHICSDGGDVTVATSRFLSPPFFFYQKEGLLIGSVFYADLWVTLAGKNRLRIGQQAFYEQLLCKRVFGNKTHDLDSKLAPPASILSFRDDRCLTKAYYKPNFRNKTSLSRKQAAGLLKSTIVDSILRKTSDGVAPALFLSGGMDTRLLAACFKEAGMSPPCYTVNNHKNREVRVAEQICRILEFQHTFIPFGEEHYTKYFPEATRVSACMGLCMPMFLGYENDIDSNVDVIFHGHGFDYFFQGMYIPRDSLSILGRQLHFSSPKQLPTDLTSFFLNNIPYIIKGVDVADYIIPSSLRMLQESMRSEIETLVEEARGISDCKYDMFEWITFSNLYRHYSSPDYWTIHENREQRTISFDNDLYNLYQSLPFSYRFDRRVMRACLKSVAPELSKLMSANTTYPVGASRWGMTARQLRDYALKAVGLSKRFENNEFERMGLPLHYAFDHHLSCYIEEMLESGRLERLRFLDHAKIRSAVPNWLADKTMDNQFLYALLSIDQFLKLVE